MESWMTGVVRVSATLSPPNYDAPWDVTTSSDQGVAVVVGPGRLLTCAHLVADAVYVEIHHPSTGDAASARVLAICHDSDLALLGLNSDTEILEGMPAAELGTLPALWDEVAIVGYESDGQGLSLVKGVVSKIDVIRYTHSQRHLLAVQLDAAIRPEHAAAPAFLDGMLVGLVMQKLTEEVNHAELVPAPIIRTFLQSARSHRVIELPALGFATQNLENPQLRAHLGMQPGDRGVVVVQIDRGGSADGILERDDVVMAIDGMPIANNGIVHYLDRHPVRYDAVLGERAIGETLQLDIKRRGENRTVELSLTTWRPLVPRARYDQPARFLVYGGLVFQPLTRDYLATWDEWWNKAPKEFLSFYYLGQRTAEREEVVVLTQILAGELTMGYDHLYNEAIATVNGKIPLDFVQFVRIMSHATGDIRIETTSGGVIVLDAARVRRDTPALLERHRIPIDRTSGLPT